MGTEKSILTTINGHTATVWFNRPKKHNALDIEMLNGILDSVKDLHSRTGLRILVIRGKGPSFCSGADLQWMQQAEVKSVPDNYKECETLARCFYEIYNSSLVTICVVHGSCFGGANGFVACSDITLAAENSVFAFSEARIGIVAATISPYITAKIGTSKSMELMLTGRRFSSHEALTAGFINMISAPEAVERQLDDLTQHILQGAPLAQRAIKLNLRSLQSGAPGESMIRETASLLAGSRISAEAKEGIAAFLEKRKPSWISETVKVDHAR